jgi:tetratricopeptide (TPR) repeat protein
MRISYSTTKKIVLVLALASLCFLFGYMYLGSYLDSLFHLPDSQTSSQIDSNGGPPAPVMQQIQELKERIKENPRDADAYEQLGDLYFNANMYDKALALYKQAVDFNREDLAARNNLAICYHLVGKDKEAFDELNTALKMAPNSQNLWITLGVISYEVGKIQQARDSLKKAIAIDPTSEAGVKAQKMLKDLVSSK